MFIPNILIKMTPHAGYDAYGQATYDEPVMIQAAIVDFIPETKRTSVRADASGSRGAADEVQISVVLLVPAYVQMKVDDMLEVDGAVLEVHGVQIKRSTDGRVDHKQVHALPRG